MPGHTGHRKFEKTYELVVTAGSCSNDTTVSVSAMHIGSVALTDTTLCVGDTTAGVSRPILLLAPARIHCDIDTIQRGECSSSSKAVQYVDAFGKSTFDDGQQCHLVSASISRSIARITASFISTQMAGSLSSSHILLLPAIRNTPHRPCHLDQDGETLRR